MAKKNQTKRKTKQTSQRTQNTQQEQIRANRVAEALMDVCAPFVDQMFEHGKVLGPNELMHLWRLGRIAWNRAVTGHKSILEAPLDSDDTTFFSKRHDIATEMISRKNKLYPQFVNEINKIIAVPDGNGTKLKVTLGEKHSKFQGVEEGEEQGESAQEDVLVETPEVDQSKSEEKTSAITKKQHAPKLDCLQEKADVGTNDIEAKIKEFDLLAAETQTRLKEIASLIESQKVPSVEETNALDNNLETLRAKYEDFVAYASATIPNEEMPPEGSSLEEYRTAIENSSTLRIREKIEEARKTLNRFSRIRGKVVEYSLALKPYQEKATELIKSLSEEKIDEITAGTAGPEVFLSAFDTENLTGKPALLMEISKYYPDQVVQWGLAGNQYYEDTSISEDNSSNSVQSSQEESTSPIEPKGVEAQEPQEEQAPHDVDLNTAETAATPTVDSESNNHENKSTDTPKKKSGKGSKNSSKKPNQVNAIKTDTPLEDDTEKTKVPNDESASADGKSDNHDNSVAFTGEESSSEKELENQSSEEDDFADKTSLNEKCKADLLQKEDISHYLEQRDAPSDEEFCILISRVLNQPATSPNQVRSVIVQAVLLANGAELEKNRPDASKYSAQLKLATHLLLEESPYSSENVTSIFPDPQNENKALLLSAYLFAMLNPSVPHDNTLWTEAKNYLHDYDSLFGGFEAFKPLFSDLISVKNLEFGFSPNVIASLGSAAEIDALINKLKNEAKNYLDQQPPKTQIKALPTFYRNCFGKGSALQSCMSIISGGKSDKKSIETVEKNLSEFCDIQDDSFTINPSKVESILDSEWEKVAGKKNFRLEYSARVHAIRQFTLRLELMLSWLEQMSYANKKEHLSRMRELRRIILESCEKIQRDGSWKRENTANVLSWLLSYMKSYLMGEISELDIFSDLLFTGAISINEEDGTPIIYPGMEKIRYFEPWRNALRHILADKKTEEEIKDEILGLANDSSNENEGMKDNLHQLEMLGKFLKKNDDDYVITAAQADAAKRYADKYIVDFKNELELAYTYGRINESEKDILSKHMEHYKGSFYGLKDFAIWRRFLDALMKQIKDFAEGRTVGLRKKIQQRLEDKPESSILLEANRILEEEHNLAVAEEYLNQFDAGQTNLDDVKRLLRESTYYTDFLDIEDSLYDETTRQFRKSWKQNDGPDDFNKIIDSWPVKGDKSKSEQLKTLFECLGFKVNGIIQRSVKNKDEVFTIPVIAPQKGQLDYTHPIAAFGTQMRPQINVVVLNSNSLTPKVLVDTISTSINLRGLAIVLISKSYKAIERRQIGELFHSTTTGQNPFLLIDHVLFLFLARLPAIERLPALLNCTLPFTTYQPFVRDGGSIPDEMFFGRTQELNTISDPNGACVVYGGRQLGKTALLERVESLCSKPKVKSFAVYSTISLCKTEKEVVSTLVKDIRKKTDERIKLRACASIKELCEQLSKLFRNDTIVTMHLLIDEVDNFLGAIADQAYKPLQPLVDLRRETKNNFKFVIAGLHNVCRAENATKENGLFGQLGSPLCIKPLSQMDALNLLSRPLSYLGFRIDRNKLETIRTNTNSYPGIIQFFGYTLVQTLIGEYQKYYRATANNPPFSLRDDQLGSVMNSADLNKSIKDKIRLTLELDPRYFMIARCITLLHYYHEGTYDDDYGFKLKDIIEIANTYKIHCLEKEKPDEYKNLLAEMEEMGIVVYQLDGRYRLRKDSFIDIIGENPEVLEQEIEQNNQEV